MSAVPFKIAKKPNQIIIAVCGPSTCGKSTLINQLRNEYQRLGINVGHVILDYFFKREKPTVNVRGQLFSNWELKESLNWDSFFREISNINSSLLFIDGFILFADQRTLDIADVCIVFEYNLATDFEIALGRRVHRIHEFQDVQIPKDYLTNTHSNGLNQLCAYFHDVVWPEMIKHPEYRTPSNCTKPLLKLSATANCDDNYSCALDFLNSNFRRMNIFTLPASNISTNSHEKNQLIIAVCGPSTSGKSSLVRYLKGEIQKRKINVESLNIDRFFKKPKDMPKVNVRGRIFLNWDLKESVNWDALYKKVSEINSDVLLLDGFILFADQRTLDIADVCIVFEYNLATDFEIALGRRVHRIHEFQDVQIPKDYLTNTHSNGLNQLCAYFHDVVWPEMLKHPEYRVPIHYSKPLLKLSATESREYNYSTALRFIDSQALMKKLINK